MILLLVSSISLFACGDSNKYKSMKISVVSTSGITIDKNQDGVDKENEATFTYSSTDNENTFTVKVSVTGVDDDVLKAVIATPTDKGLITVRQSDYNRFSGETMFVFSVNVVDGTTANDSTVIHFQTEEGNKSLDYKINVVIPLRDIRVSETTIPIIRGQEIKLDEYSKFINYIPANTTQKGVTCSTA